HRCEPRREDARRRSFCEATRAVQSSEATGAAPGHGAPSLHTPPSRVSCLSVGAGRFELPTSRTRTVRATKLRYAPRGRRKMFPSSRAVKRKLSSDRPGWDRLTGLPPTRKRASGSMAGSDAIPSRCRSGATVLLELRDERGHGLEQIGDQAVVGDLEDRGFRVLVDRDD